MYARVSHIQGTPNRAADAEKIVRDQIYPSVTKLKGNKGMLSLIDRTSGKMIAITFWENEAALRASAEAANTLRQAAATSGGAAAAPIVETYEVMEQPGKAGMSPVWRTGEAATADY